MPSPQMTPIHLRHIKSARAHPHDVAGTDPATRETFIKTSGALSGGSLAWFRMRAPRVLPARLPLL